MSKFSRLVSVFLCLILAFTFAFSPIQAKAYATFNPATSALFSLFFSSDFVPDTVDALAPFLQRVLDSLTQPVSDYFTEILESNPQTFTPTESVIRDVLDATKYVYMQYGDWPFKSSIEELTYEEFVSAGTELYIPTEEQLLNLDLLTAQQLIVDYTKEQVSLSKQIKSALQSFSYSMQGFTESFAEDYASFQTMVYSYLSASTDWLFSINDNIKVKLNVVHDWLSTINTNIVTKLNLMQDWFPTINENIKTRLDTVATWLSTLNTNMKSELSQVKDWLKGIKTSVTTQGQQIVQKLDDIYDQILTFPRQEQIEILQKPQIQVPIHAQQQVLVTDYASLGSAFEMKFSWIPQIFNFLRELFNRIVYTGEPPKISVPLTAATGSVKFSSDVVCLDMSFYEPYKSYGDLIISGFLWLGFGWNLYKRTPSILSGMGISQMPVADGAKRGKNDD